MNVSNIPDLASTDKSALHLTNVTGIIDIPTDHNRNMTDIYPGISDITQTKKN
jgi:hypothetical protein